MHRRCWHVALLLLTGAIAGLVAASDRPHAQSQARYCITGVGADKTLAVHKAPGLDTPRVGSIRGGVCDVRYMGLETRDGRWVLVNHRGTEGWILVRYLRAATPQAPPAAEQQAFFRVVGVAAWDKLNVRAQPSSSGRLRGALAPETTCVVRTGACRRGWCPIRFRNVSGWVNARYLKPETSQRCGSE